MLEHVPNGFRKLSFTNLHFLRHPHLTSLYALPSATTMHTHLQLHIDGVFPCSFAQGIRHAKGKLSTGPEHFSLDSCSDETNHMASGV